MPGIMCQFLPFMQKYKIQPVSDPGQNVKLWISFLAFSKHFAFYLKSISIEFEKWQLIKFKQGLSRGPQVSADSLGIRRQLHLTPSPIKVEKTVGMLLLISFMCQPICRCPLCYQYYLDLTHIAWLSKIEKSNESICKYI